MFILTEYFYILGPCQLGSSRPDSTSRWASWY